MSSRLRVTQRRHQLLNLDANYTSGLIKNSDELAASRAATVTSQTEYYYGPRFQQTYTSVSGKFYICVNSLR